jgi:polyhydroxybutyrate depolymerase
MRALTSRAMTVAGLNRTYTVYLPETLSPATPVPLVFVHHGYTMSGLEMVGITEYASLADSEGIAVAFPDGEAGPNSLGAPWNVGTNVCVPGNLEEASGDDFDFVTAIQTDVELDQCIDEQHVFLTGFSMGGYFAHNVGCMRPDLARAVAPHSGGTYDFSACASGHKPVIIFHWDSDPVIPESCDTTAASQWVAKNGCETTVNTVTVQNGHCDYYQGCPADGQVAICIFNGMGHCWAGGAADAGIFACPTYASATQLEWSFFKQYAW